MFSLSEFPCSSQTPLEPKKNHLSISDAACCGSCDGGGGGLPLLQKAGGLARVVVASYSALTKSIRQLIWEEEVGWSILSAFTVVSVRLLLNLFDP